MWHAHWDLSRDPFSGRGSPFVPTAAHQEALARLTHLIESGERWAELQGEAGTGTSRVLDEALAQVRNPFRRVALARAPVDTRSMLTDLAQGLGVQIESNAGLVDAWRTLSASVRLARPQGLAVVLALDDLDGLGDRMMWRNDLPRLARLDPHFDARTTLIVVGRELPLDAHDHHSAHDWNLAIRLKRLTRSESEQYLTAALAAAGRTEPAFTPRAIVGLHALTGGIPQGLNRLARLALMAGALQKREIVTREIVEGVALECVSGSAALVNTI